MQRRLDSTSTGIQRLRARLVERRRRHRCNRQESEDAERISVRSGVAKHAVSAWVKLAMSSMLNELDIGQPG